MSKLFQLIAIAMVVPNFAQAQEWSDEQQEVWAAEVACWEARSVDEIMPCFHDDFVGWGIPNNGVTTTKADRRPGFARTFETEENIFLQLIPVDIIVRGDMAVIMYVANYATRDRAGVEKNYSERWTDVMLNDGGRWSWISDHGADISEN